MIRKVRTTLLVLVIIAALILIFEATRPYRPDNPIDEFVDVLVNRDTVYTETIEDEPIVYIELPADAVLEDVLLVSDGRSKYIDNVMTLLIPKLDLSKPVCDGTSYAGLRTRPGLFAASGMPGEPGANVSMAGHRTRDMFYHLDRLGDGDRIYLVYDSHTYTYLYYDTTEVLPTNWDVIAPQGFDCCTLITCTPIGVANRRMIVRFTLESVSVEEETDSISEESD